MKAAEKIASITKLYKGAHEPDGEMCVMEAVAFVAGEKWSDSPACACPVIGAFLRSWNDNLPDDERTALLLPLVPRLVGTRGSKELKARRAMMAADWYVRVQTPAWLRLAGLNKQADELAAFPEITSFEKTPSLRPVLEAISRDADAAWSAARSAAWSAARSAAWSAAESAARSAAWSAAESAARSAAWSAAWSAAESAAWSAAESAARSAARSAAWSAAWNAARSAAWNAAWSAAESAAWNAARSAAWNAAWSAAESAAWSAAESAARSAARSAAWNALETTRRDLQQSALALVIRMIDEPEPARPIRRKPRRGFARSAGERARAAIAKAR